MSEYKIVGSSFKDSNIKDNIYPRIKVGSKGFLKKEFENKYDPNAVKVIIYDEVTDNFWDVGYIPKGSEIDMPYREHFFTVTKVNNGKYLTLDEPSLPHMNACATIRDKLYR